MKEIVIDEKLEGQTIYKFVKKYLNEAPISFIEKIFRLKDVKINNIRINKTQLIKKGDVVKIYVSDEQLKEFSSSKKVVHNHVNLHIIYEDENILIVNKPSGLLVHGDENEKRITLSNFVLSYLKEKNEYDDADTFIPSPAHRIDRNTSGIVIFGKNIKSLQALEDLFKERESIEKYYLALVVGTLTTPSTINKPLYKDEKKGIVMVKSVSQGGKTAITNYQIEANYQNYTLVKAEILTGRTHQIRVHFASINHPLIGDSKYGNFQANKEFKNKYQYEGQFLHAYMIKLKKIDGYLSYLSDKTFICDLPEKEKKILEKIKREK